MYERLKNYVRQQVQVSAPAIEAMEAAFVPGSLSKRGLLLEYGHVCQHVYFINSGVVRHYLWNEAGEEVTCDFTFDGQFVTDYHSFLNEAPSTYGLQALEPLEFLAINKSHLLALYSQYPAIETLGRQEAEKTAQRIIAMAQGLLSDKAEVRYLRLLERRPELVARIPQKYIAAYLGMKPESLSRIRKKIAEI